MDNKKKRVVYWIIASVVALGIIAFSGYKLPILLGKMNSAILTGEIRIGNVKLLTENMDKIAPGSSVILSAKIHNTGSQANAPGEIFIRYGFAKPMDTHVNSVIFETEKLPLEILQPNQQVDIVFKGQHQWPSLADFIRNDWPLRQYQLVAVIDNKEYVLGTKAITFSAYYYGGPSVDIALPVPTVQQVAK